MSLIYLNKADVNGTLQELEFTAFLTNDYIYHVGIPVYGICDRWLLRHDNGPRAMFCAWMSLYSLEWEFLYYTSTSSFGGQAIPGLGISD